MTGTVLQFQPRPTTTPAPEPSNPTAWQIAAACLGMDPDLFFPERGASTREAKTVCATCPVRIACLEYALVNVEKFGVWGGTSERERRQIRRARVQTVAS